jgi:hypothetical protein
MESILLLLIIPISIFAWYWFFFRTYDPGSQGIRSSSRNLVFPFIEAYLYYKSAAIKSATNGSGAENYIKSVLGQAAQDLPESGDAVLIFNKFLSIMTSWSKKVDKNLNDSKKLTLASKKLETDIDKIIPLCEELGWKFKTNWR